MPQSVCWLIRSRATRPLPPRRGSFAPRGANPRALHTWTHPRKRALPGWPPSLAQLAGWRWYQCCWVALPWRCYRTIASPRLFAFSRPLFSVRLQRFYCWDLQVCFWAPSSAANAAAAGQPFSGQLKQGTRYPYLGFRVSALSFGQRVPTTHGYDAAIAGTRSLPTGDAHDKCPILWLARIGHRRTTVRATVPAGRTP